MRRKKINIDIVAFSLAVVCITGCFLLAYTPRLEHDTRGISNIALYKEAGDTALFSEVYNLRDKFLSHPKPTIYSKRTSNAFWIRFTIDPSAEYQDASRRYIHIPNASLEQIDVYYPDGSRIRAGKRVPSDQLAVKSRTWHLPIPHNLKADAEVFIRIRTNTIMWVPLHISSTQEMFNHTQKETLLFGSFFGILFAILFVNLFSFIIVKNKNFLLYVLYLLSLIIYHLRVHGYLYYLPLSFDTLERILWLSLCGVGVFMVLFSIYFLELKKRAPLMRLVLYFCAALFLPQTLLGLFLQNYWANQFAYVTGFIIPLLIITTTARMYFQGHQEVRYYLLAWAALFTATLIWSTAAYAEAQIPANYFFIAGTTIDSLLFTLAIFDLIRKQLSDRQQVLEREKYYQDLSRTDPLTGLYNRRYLNEIVKRLETDRELPESSAMIMIDLDNFKEINDTHGHLTGDIILTKTGTKIKRHIRKSDIACRYGGDEFLIFLPGAHALAAKTIAENIRNDVIADAVFSEKGEPVYITISIGLTENRPGDSFDGLFLRADAALYQAKKTGRDKIEVL